LARASNCHEQQDIKMMGALLFKQINIESKITV